MVVIPRSKNPIELNIVWGTLSRGSMSHKSHSCYLVIRSAFNIIGDVFNPIINFKLDSALNIVLSGTSLLAFHWFQGTSHKVSATLPHSLLESLESCIKSLLPIITRVRLSILLLFMASLMTASTHNPQRWCKPISSASCLWRSTVSHTSFTTSFESILSNIPSQPRIIKSWFCLIRNCFISGSAITTLWLPDNL